ncbi:hypothetical protein [Micromonospora fulviviridis]|uniref:Helicase C-terminal domain-containing protein n=1 Tax=Micromonospora fulviviridis TaxID=47860 RepID=A0ABV2VVD8_9ACTN
MPDLSAVARERAALATIADAIVAASVDKGLRVEVACPTSRLAVVDRLAQALHARGRVCRCRAAGSDAGEAGGPPPQWGQPGSGVVVITGGHATGIDRGVLRVDVRVTAAVATQDRGVSRTGSPADSDPDIVLDYQDPGGPVIRYLAPHLSAGDRNRSAGVLTRRAFPSLDPAIIAPWRLVALLDWLPPSHCSGPSAIRPGWPSCAGSRPARRGWSI